MAQQQPMTNGVTPQSQTLNHFTSYPLVSDSMTLYTSNPLGAKSIELFNTLYANLASPILPYLATPYTYAKPYLERADNIGDSSLKSVDDRFPSVKTTNLESLKGFAFETAHFPFKLAGQGRDYVYSTYGEEYEKVGGEKGVFRTGKAVISAELRIVSDGMRAVADFIGPKKDEAVKKAEAVKAQGQEKVNGLAKEADKKKESVKGGK